MYSVSKSSTSINGHLNPPTILIILTAIFGYYSTSVGLVTSLASTDRFWFFQGPSTTYESRQLIRHKILTTPCNIGALFASSAPPYRNLYRLIQYLNQSTDDHGTHSLQQEDRVNIATTINQLDIAKRKLELQCGEEERISVIGLEDLSTVELDAPWSIYPSQGSPDKLCRHRLQIMQTRKSEAPLTATPSRVSEEDTMVSNQLWSEDTTEEEQFMITCNNLISAEQEILNNLTSRCSSSNKCSLFVPYANELMVQDCIQLNHFDLTPIIRITYLCLPIESRFKTRTVRYQDITNSMSCTGSDVLYLKRSAVYMNKSNSDVNCRKHPKICEHESENYDSVELDDTDEQDQNSPLVLSPRALHHNELIDDENDIISRVQVGGEILSPTRGKRNYDQILCSNLSSIPESIIESCHIKFSCPLSLNRIVGTAIRETTCNLTMRNLDSLYAEFDYACVDSGKFGESSSNGKSHVETTVTQDVLKYEYFNAHDYNISPTIFNELGQLSLHHLNSRVRSSATATVNHNHRLISEKLKQSYVAERRSPLKTLSAHIEPNIMIISAAILSKNGNIFCSNHLPYEVRVDISKHVNDFLYALTIEDDDIELPYIETKNLRYIYKQTDDLYWLLVTSLESDMFTDIRLLGKFVCTIMEYGSLETNSSTLTDEQRELFYRHIWRPWDDDTQCFTCGHQCSTTELWEHAFESRVQFLISIRDGHIHDSDVTYFNALIAESWSINAKLSMNPYSKRRQDEFSSGSDSVCSSETNSISEETVIDGCRLKCLLEDIRLELKRIQDPYLRLFAKRNLLSANSYNEDMKASTAPSIEEIDSEEIS